MKAMIFAAGYGKRLQPLTTTTPKALADIQGKPILQLIIERLLSYNVKEFVINTHHLHHKIADFLTEFDSRASIKISYEQTILGTGGGLYKTKDYWGETDIYVCNSDILCNLDLSKLFEFHSKADATVTLATNKVHSDSMLLTDQKNRLVGIERKGQKSIISEPAGKVKPVGFCGMQVISSKLFEYLNEKVAFSIVDEYLSLIEKGLEIKTWDIGDSYWTDIGSMENLETANKQFPGFV